MRALVFGRTGQVARELARHDGVIALGRPEVDLSDAGQCVAAIERNDVDAVINAAAYTAVDRAESEEALAYRVNAEAPGAMAMAARRKGIPLVHISTDYVFDGSGESGWRPGDATAPLNAYGRTKLAGEAAVRAAGSAHAILRTSWVFSAHGHNFVKTILRLSAERDRLTIVGDQFGGPTPASAIARACLTIAADLVRQPGKTGTYHLSGAPDVSWAGFAEEIVRQAGRDTVIVPIETEDYPTPAARPRNSRLECSEIERVFGIGRPHWKATLADALQDLSAR